MGITSTVPETGNVPPAAPADETQRISARWLSDALLVAGVPAALYVLTLAFHVGFASTFEIPFQFITVSWTDTFVIGSILFGIALLFLQVGFFIFSFWKTKHEPAYLRALKWMPILMLLADFIYVVWTDWHRLIQISAFISFGLGLTSGWILRGEEQIHRKLDPRGLRHWRIGLLAFLWAISGVMTSFIAGAETAKYQRNFYVSQSSPEMVVLGIWGDTVLAAPFDRQTRTVKTEFTITKISDHSPLDIRGETIGPLHIETPH